MYGIIMCYNGHFHEELLTQKKLNRLKQNKGLTITDRDGLRTYFPAQKIQRVLYSLDGSVYHHLDRQPRTKEMNSGDNCLP